MNLFEKSALLVYFLKEQAIKSFSEKNYKSVKFYNTGPNMSLFFVNRLSPALKWVGSSIRGF